MRLRRRRGRPGGVAGLAGEVGPERGERPGLGRAGRRCSALAADAGGGVTIGDCTVAGPTPKEAANRLSSVTGSGVLATIEAAFLASSPPPMNCASASSSPGMLSPDCFITSSSVEGCPASAATRSFMHLFASTRLLPIKLITDRAVFIVGLKTGLSMLVSKMTSMTSSSPSLAR
jgi:hypothetical protein